MDTKDWTITPKFTRKYGGGSGYFWVEIPGGNEPEPAYVYMDGPHLRAKVFYDEDQLAAGWKFGPEIKDPK